MLFYWDRYGGYECSTRGDKRFSAFFALMPDGRSIEQHFQCDVKGYAPGGSDWRLGKGKRALNPAVDLWVEYLALWKIWASNHQELMRELKYLAAQHNNILSDSFAKTSINQARALSVLLNTMEI